MYGTVSVRKGFLACHYDVTEFAPAEARRLKSAPLCRISMPRFVQVKIDFSFLSLGPFL